MKNGGKMAESILHTAMRTAQRDLNELRRMKLKSKEHEAQKQKMGRRRYSPNVRITLKMSGKCPGK